MVPDKLTLFELHFDDAQFGPATMNTGGDDADETADTPELDDAMPEAASAADAETEDELADDGGMGRVLTLVGASLALAVGATVLARRLSGDDEETTLDEFAEEPVEVETGDSGAE